MKRFLFVVGIACSLNAGVALAQHENMPGHGGMDGGHANMPAGDKAAPDKKKMGSGKKMGNMDNTGMKQEPKPAGQKQ